MLNNIRRTDIEDLLEFGWTFQEPWQVVNKFETTLAEYFGAPFAVATDSCTHGIELCARLFPKASAPVKVPKYTYMSVPMTFDKLGIPYVLTDEQWRDHYTLFPYPIVDAATVFAKNCYTPGTYMNISFQIKKHLPIGRGGMIFLDNKEHYAKLQRMVWDGRDRTVSHANDNVKELGFHYYMTPEDAARGLKLFMLLKDKPNAPWSYKDYTDLTEKDFFRGK